MAIRQETNKSDSPSPTSKSAGDSAAPTIPEPPAAPTQPSTRRQNHGVIVGHAIKNHVDVEIEMGTINTGDAVAATPPSRPNRRGVDTDGRGNRIPGAFRIPGASSLFPNSHTSTRRDHCATEEGESLEDALIRLGIPRVQDAIAIEVSNEIDSAPCSNNNDDAFNIVLAHAEPINTITFHGREMKRSTVRWVLCLSLTIFAAIIAPVCIYVTGRNDKGNVGGVQIRVSDPTDKEPSIGQPLDYATLNKLFSDSMHADPNRCQRGYAPVCGDCWCGIDDDEIDASCPSFPMGFVDGCTDTARRLRLASVYAKYILLEEDDEVPLADDYYSTAHLNADRLPSLRPIHTNETMSPLIIDVSESQDGTAMTPCNIFGDMGAMYDNPFKDLPLCFSFPDYNDRSYNEGEAVCAFKVKNLFDDDKGKAQIDGACGEGETLYNLRTLSSTDSAMNDPSLQIVHMGPCHQCSTAQDLASSLVNADSFIAQSIACILGSGMNPDQSYAKDEETNLFPEFYSCYQDMGLSEGCSLALASVIDGIGFFCEKECGTSLGEILFQDGGSMYWLGGPPPTCKKHACDTCIDNSNSFALEAIVRIGSAITSVLVDQARKCKNYKGVDTDSLILDPCGEI